MIDVPKRYHCNTGDGSPAHDERDRFFTEVMEHIGIPSDRPNPFRIECFNL
jgi:hypothetical protein